MRIIAVVMLACFGVSLMAAEQGDVLASATFTDGQARSIASFQGQTLAVLGLCRS